MKLIKNRKIVEDTWLTVADDAPLPDEGDVVVSLSRLEQHASELRARPGLVGVRLEADVSIDQVKPFLSLLSLIKVDFPKYTDGRSYSTARLLRDRHEYRGEIRAVGNVLRDQLFYMARCGIDCFELQAGKDLEDALEAFDDFSTSYQAAADDRRPLFQRVQRG